MDCCQFFKDNMKDLPKTAEYIKNKLCFADFERCNRFRIYTAFGKGSVPSDIDPDDTEAVNKVLECLQHAGLKG